MSEGSQGINHGLMAQIRASEGGGGSGEIIELGDLPKKGMDKLVKDSIKYIGAMFGLGINAEIEGKSAFSGLETDNVGSGLSLTAVSLVPKDKDGGMLTKIFKHFTRDLPAGVGGGLEGLNGSGDGGGGGGGSGGGDYSGGGGDYASSGHGGGGGDFYGHASHGGEGMVVEASSYGGKNTMVMAEASYADLGNLPSQSVGSRQSSELGMSA